MHLQQPNYERLGIRGSNQHSQHLGVVFANRTTKEKGIQQSLTNNLIRFSGKLFCQLFGC